MNTVDTEKFIECVKKYPILYNRRDTFYNNLSKKAQAWNEVGKEMNESSEVLKIKWKGLKDGYTKYKRFQAGVASANKSYRSWCWSENLKFLDEYAINKKYCKYKQAMSIDSTPSPPQQPCPSPAAEDNDSQDNVEPEQWTASPTQSDAYLSRRRTMSATDEDFEAKRPKLDSVDHLFSSYAETFRKFTLRTQCMLKMQMAKIFGDAELEEFDSVSEVLGSVGTSTDKEKSQDVETTSQIKIERIDDDTL